MVSNGSVDFESRAHSGIRPPSRVWTDPSSACTTGARPVFLLTCATNHKKCAPQLRMPPNEAPKVVSAELPRAGTVLESEIVGNKAKVRTVSKLSEEDARSIANLNDDREKKQTILNDNQVLLREVMEENGQVTAEIVSYETELEECVANERGHKDYLKQLRSRRAELSKEHDDLGTQIPQLQDSNRITTDKLERKERDIDEAQTELKRIEDMLEARHREGQEEQQKLFNLERDREATRLRLRDTQQILKEQQTQVSQAQDSTRQLEKKVREQKRRFDGVKQEKQEASERCQKFQKDLENVNQSIVAIEDEIRASNHQFADKQTIVRQLQAEVQARDANRTKVQQKVQELQEQYEKLRKDNDALRKRVAQTEELLESLGREGETIRKQTDAITRDENAKLKKKEGEVAKQNAIQVLLHIYKSHAHNIECEISIIKTHLQDTQRKIYALENDSEHYSEELSAATSQYMHAQDVLKEVDARVEQKNREIREGDLKVHRQQALYEKTRTERENAAKKVREVEAEIRQLEGLFARMKFAIEQHKDDIKRKDRERMNDRRALETVNEEDGRLREKLTEVQLDSSTADRARIAHEGELSKLDQTIRDAEAHLHNDEQKLANVKKKRDQMSNQNVEKELELRTMHEKLEVLRNQCHRGELDYDLKETEISRIRAQLAHDQKCLDELSEIDVQLAQRRHHVHVKQKELLQLRAERAAMEEELSIPINIHRWTLLESADPMRFERLKRYQELQADLVSRTKEVADLQEKIKERESYYMELCAQLRRKPGLEVDQRVNEYRMKCKSERFDLDQITSKLEMFRDVAKEYRKELADVQSELTNQRDKWIRQKKRDIKQRQELARQQEELKQMGLDLSLTF
jgi:chromosome segregation ATPase